MTSSIRDDRPADGDPYHQAKSRQQFRAAIADIEALQLNVGLFSTISVAGYDSEDVELQTAHGRFNLVTSGSSSNDFDLQDGVHGQEVTIVHSSGTEDATVTELAGVTIVQADNTAVTTITLQAGEWIVLKYYIDRWVITHNNGATIA